VAVVALLVSSFGQASANIVDDWATIKPPPPMLKPVTIDGAPNEERSAWASLGRLSGRIYSCW
jgi:hypothetical protein